jgi:myosin protein heavy chain
VTGVQTCALPILQNALARLNQTDGISADEKSRIRTMLQGVMKKLNPDYQPSEKERIEDLEKENEELQKEIKELKAKHAEELAGKDKEIAINLEKINSLDERNKVLEDRNAKDKTKLKEIDGRLRETETRVSDRDHRIDVIEKETEKLREDLGAASQRAENAISERNVATAKALASDTHANSEIHERARVTLENADLREKYAKVTREFSDLTQKRSDDAKKLFTLEKEIAEFKNKLQEIEANKEKLNEALKDAHKFQGWAWRKLNAAGIFKADPAKETDKSAKS